MKLKVLVPALPSVSVTSVTVRFGVTAAVVGVSEEIVDGEAVVGAGRVDVEPADPEGRAVGDGEAGDVERQGGAVRGQIAVQGAGRAGRDRGVEIELVDVGPGAGGEAGRVEADLEVELVGDGAVDAAEPPLLADIGDQRAR